MKKLLTAEKSGIIETITGFTLAEVLITLTIIGVIAALTIPALLQNIQDAQLKTAWKRTYSDITQAVSKASMDNAGSFNGVLTSSDNTLLYLLAPYLSTVKQCSHPNTFGNCWVNANAWYNMDGSIDTTSVFSLNPGAATILSNGVFIKFITHSSNSDADIAVDVNGFKGPNIIGKDIFAIHIISASTKPYGYVGDSTSMKNCDTSGTGWGCSAKYLMQ